MIDDPPTNLNARIAAYRIAEANLLKPFTIAQIKKHANPETYSQDEMDEIMARADYILRRLHEDAKNLWDES